MKELTKLIWDNAEAGKKTFVYF